MNTVFELGGDLVRDEVISQESCNVVAFVESDLKTAFCQVAHNVMRLIAEGSDEEAQNIQEYAVDCYVALLDTSVVLPDVMVHVGFSQRQQKRLVLRSD